MTFEDLFQTVAAGGGEISLSFGRVDERRPSNERTLRIEVRMPGEKRLTISRVMLARSQQRVAGAEERFHLRDAVCEIGDVVAQRAISPSKVVDVLLGGKHGRPE